MVTREAGEARLGAPNAEAIARAPFGRLERRPMAVVPLNGRARTAWFASRLYSARLRRWAAAVQHRDPWLVGPPSLRIRGG